MNWPLGVHPNMDKMAKDSGLAHWSCTKELSNCTWMRQDGEVFKPRFHLPGGWPSELKMFDASDEMIAPVYGVEPVKKFKCDKPPEGWLCSRESGHDGPCAVRPKIKLPNLEVDTNKWFYICSASVAVACVIGLTVYNVFALFHGMKP